MEINERNIRIDSALRAALKIGALSVEEYDAACRLITAGEKATPQPTTQFEAWAKLHHYDLVRCSHEPYAAYRSDLTNAALAGWRGGNAEAVPQAALKVDERAAAKRAIGYVMAMEGPPSLIKTLHSMAEGMTGHCAAGSEKQAAQRDAEITQLIDERDSFEHMGTVLAGKVSELLNIDVGEWSSANNPIFRAIHAIEDRIVAAPVAPAATTQPDERAAFEEWAKDQGFPIGQSDVGDGLSYLDLRTQGAFDAWQASASAPQSAHYQQLLGVAYVVLGCLAANGIDIPERFLDAFSDPDSVENPLELLPCDFSPAQAVRAAVEAAALTDEQRDSIREAAQCLAYAVTMTQDGYDGETGPASEWDAAAQRLSGELNALLAAQQEGS